MVKRGYASAAHKTVCASCGGEVGKDGHAYAKGGEVEDKDGESYDEMTNAVHDELEEGSDEEEAGETPQEEDDEEEKKALYAKTISRRR